MRKLRFRLWDYALNLMDYSGLWSIGFDGRLYYGNAEFSDYKVIVMEYIGHKDGKGTEIYEGDIIGNNTANYVYIVTKDKYGWALQPTLNQRGLAVNQRIAAKGGTKFMPEYPLMSFEDFGGIGEFDVVISNIFENKDLLGGNYGKS